MATPPPTRFSPSQQAGPTARAQLPQTAQRAVLSGAHCLPMAQSGPGSCAVGHGLSLLSRVEENLWADGGYAGILVAWALQMWRYTVEIVKRTAAHTFKVLPRRWVVERTFGWLNRYHDSVATTNAGQNRRGHGVPRHDSPDGGSPSSPAGLENVFLVCSWERLQPLAGNGFGLNASQFTGACAGRSARVFARATSSLAFSAASLCFLSVNSRWRWEFAHPASLPTRPLPGRATATAGSPAFLC